MKLIPMPKTITLESGVCDVSTLFLDTMTTTLAPHVMLELSSLVSENGTIPLTVTCGDDAADEAYTLAVCEDGVSITAQGERGVFYAVQTLKQLAANGATVPCVSIADVPDFAYRGFYQDVSRGRIPTVETVKKLVDRLAALKMNSLQLYVEHTHRFAEYAGINDDLGYYTDDEIRELDRYCAERYIELIPSLSSFGHLYFLLQSDRFSHLSEMENYQPSIHNWHERLIHHTIDPNAAESFEVITSLISQYEPLFTSKHFNICCDETFDLCKGRNAGGDAAKAYVGFVTKLVSFLRERGKTVMMWGDIVMKHPECFDELPDDICYLNWCYDANGNGLQAEVIREHGRRQIVCPSVHSHKRLIEKIEYSLPNIKNVAEAGLKNGAFGVLTTNWGDYGHLCFDEAMLCGLAFSAAVSWNVSGTDQAAFEDAAASLVYRAKDGEIIEIIRAINRCDELFLDSFGYEKALWELTVQYFDNERGIPKDFDRHKSDLQKLDLEKNRAICAECAARVRTMLDSGDVDADIGEAMVIAADGAALIFGILDAACHDRAIDEALVGERDAWLSTYRALWERRNKIGEWSMIETFFNVNMMR
ncbi:MAG: family 20 glycosylhydrolase [Clostridia bacterium]|nr:family 20 glycosylhydrolase [Clostridia bacterium]